MNSFKAKHVFLPIVTILVTISVHASPLIDDTLLPHVSGTLTILPNKQSYFGRSSITYFKDDIGQQFVLKSRNNRYDDQPIKDALGAYIGNDLDIPINKVTIILPDTSLTGKNIKHAASLHTHVPGKELCKINNDNLINKLYSGQLYLENKDLQKIAALDVFLSNPDRTAQNLFLDQKNNRYYAIDMDYIYYGNTRKNIWRFIKDFYLDFVANMQKNTAFFITKFMNNPKFTEEQKYQALTQFHNTLKSLINKYPPSKIYNLWLAFAEKAKYTYHLSQKIMMRIKITRNYSRSKKLLKSIEKTLKTKPQTIKIII